MAERVACNVETVYAKLRSKPRNQANAYITDALYRELESTAPLLPGLQSENAVLELGSRAGGIYYVTYVVYDDGYETPDEFCEDYWDHGGDAHAIP